MVTAHVPARAGDASGSSIPRHRYFCALAFAIFAIANSWFIRLEPALPKNSHSHHDKFESVLTKGLLQDLETPLKAIFTGISGLDAVISRLVLVFAPGPFRFDDVVSWQQTNLIVNFSAVITLLGVEAFRNGNKGRIITLTSIWAVFYQTLSGAIVLPVYYFVYSLTVPAPSTSTSPGAAISIKPTVAFAFVPSVILFYVLPTFGMYYLPPATSNSQSSFLPSISADALQNLIAFWQFSPVFVNASTWIISLFLPSSAVGDAGKKRSLSILYNTIYVICAVAHIITVYHCFSSSSSPLSVLSRIFIPSMSGRRKNVIDTVHYIFVWDYWGIFVPSLVWIAMSYLEVSVAREGRGESGSGLGSLFGIFVFAVLLGPGALMARVWVWREKALDELASKRVEREKDR